jgi:hypothetical protein
MIETCFFNWTRYKQTHVGYRTSPNKRFFQRPSIILILSGNPLFLKASAPALPSCFDWREEPTQTALMPEEGCIRSQEAQ